MEKYEGYGENEVYVVGWLMKENAVLEELRVRGKEFIEVQDNELFEGMMEVWEEEKGVNEMSVS
ncbi:hypothetical protein, partial [Bacillus thuringiensis]|uniref:hypothetical protein n=1 Tax=Bacillus thuringiensis TaxID=1428 RepID=UPI00119E900E